MSSKVRKKDKWSLKKWYEVYSPATFGLRKIAEIPSDSDEKVLGRTIEISLYEITQDYSQLPIKLKFQITRVKDNKAYTQFKGYMLTRDYVKSLVRRGSTKIEGIFNIYTKDNIPLRVTAMTIATHRIKTSQEKEIRKIMKKVVEGKASQLNFDEFIQEAVLGKIASEIYNACRKIYPLRKAEIVKIKMLLSPLQLIPVT